MTDAPVDLTPSAPEAPAPEPTLEEAMGGVFDKIERRERMPEKGDDGRFISANPKPEAAPPEATPAAPITDQPAQPEGGTPQASIAPPDSWSAENKAEFAKLPPAMQAYIAQREGDAHKAITQKGEELKRFEPWQRVIEPHAQRIRSLGVSEPEFVNRLLVAEQQLTDPRTRVDAFRWLAQQYGQDLSQLATPTQPGVAASNTPADPALAAIIQKVDGLTSWATQQEQQRERAQAAREAAATRDAASKAEAFLNDPKYPYAKELEADMSALILASRRLGQELTLEQAYAKATRANDQVWQKIETERSDKAKKEAEAEAARKAAEVKKRAPLVVKPRGSGALAPSSKLSLEDRMRDAYDRLNGAA